MNITYWLMLVFVFWVLWRIGNIYSGIYRKLGGTYHHWLDTVLLYAFAVLGTYFFHNVW